MFTAKRVRRVVLTTLSLSTLLGVLFYAAPIHAAIPEFINYQSRLRDSGGDAISATTTIRFAIYSVATGGTPTSTVSENGPLLWTEIYNQPSGSCAYIDPDNDGYFTVQLGSCVSFPDYLDFDTSSLYVGVTIENDIEASPRAQLGTAPFAFTSERVFGTTTSAIGTTTPVDNAVLTVEATSTTAIATVIRGIVGQIADLFQIVTAAGEQLLTLTANGFLGIGTSTPTAKLSVEGAAYIVDDITTSYVTATSTIATSTFPLLSTTALTVGNDYLTDLVGNGLVITNNVLTVATSTFNLDPSAIDLPQGYLLVGTGTGNAQATSSIFVDTNTGNVGIGTTTPSNTLVIVGTTTAAGNITPSIDDVYALGSESLRWKDLFVGPGTIYIGDSSASTTISASSISGDAAALDLKQNIDGVSVFSFKNESTGSSAIGGVKVFNDNDDFIGVYKTGSNYFGGAGRGTLFNSGGVTEFINTDANTGYLWYNDFITSQNLLMTLTGDGNLGIGTSSPYAKLSVVGQAVAEYFTATSTSATSTLSNLSAVALSINADYLTDLTGTGLINSGGALTVATSSFNLDPSSIDLTQGYLLVGDPSGNAQATSSIFVDTNTGNLGLGTTTPLALLTVGSTGNFTVDSSGNVTLGADSTVFSIGTGSDLQITHNGTNSILTSAAGNLLIDNTNTTGATQLQLGTDTAATAFQVLNNSGNTLFEVGAGGDIYSGLTWRAGSFPATGIWRAAAGGEGVLIAIQQNSPTANNTVARSFDGETWEALTLPSSPGVPWTITYGDGVFVLTSVSKTYVSSDKGETWSEYSFPSVGFQRGGTYGKGKFVVGSLASSNNIYVSEDAGQTWTTASTPLSASLYRIIGYGGDTFVLVGRNGEIFTSTDASTWTTRSNPATGFDGLDGGYAYGNGTHVVAGQEADSDNIIYSTDSGATWTAATNPVSEPIGAILFQDGFFIAVTTTNGELLTSPDGVTWTQRGQVGYTSTTDGAQANGVMMLLSGSQGANVRVSGQAEQSVVGDPNVVNGNFLVQGGKIGIGTSSPFATLSVVGNGHFDSDVTSSFFTATSTSATSTFPNLLVTALSVGADYLTDLTGTGLTAVNGVLNVDSTSFFSLSDWFATTTDALTEGSTNRYYATALFASDLAGTTTDALTEGITNLYWTNGRFDTRLSATTTLPNLTTLVGLTDIVTTNATTTNFGVNGETFTDLTGTGLINSGGALTVATSSFNLDPSSIDLTQGYLLVGDPSGNAQATSSLFISSAGSVGLGDSTPDFLLDVDGTFGAGGNVTFGDSSGDTVTSNAATWTFTNDTAVILSGGTNGLNIDAGTLSIDATNDRVGIGTISPDVKLHIDAGSAGSGDEQIVRLSHAGSGVGDDVILELQPASSNGSFDAPAKIVAEAPGALDVELAFYTTDNNTSSEVLRIDDEGNLGIGTSSPFALLSVAGDSYFSGSATSSGSINIGNALGINNEYFTDLTGVGLTFTNGALTVATSTFNLDPSTIDLNQGYLLVGDPTGNAQATSTIFINTSSGRVGIGTQSPSAQLSVSGDSTFSGTSTFSGGVGIANAVPDITTDTFYNQAGVLYWNGYDLHTSEPIWWTAQSAAGDNDDWDALTYGNGRYVALSPTGDRAMYSDDGMNWATTTIGGDNDQWRGAAYGNGRYVAVARGGDDLIAYSDDGVSWTTVSFSDNNEDWYAVTHGNGRFVAVGLTGDRVAYSDDGVNWASTTAAGDDDNWISVTHGEGRYVAVAASGGDRVMYSDDGVTWTPVSAAGDNDVWYSVTYGNGRFVAVSISGDRAMYSDDGVTWVTTTAVGDNDSWRAVNYGNGYFVAVGSSGDDRVMYSPDGITWTGVSAAGDNDNWNSLTYGDGRFVAGSSFGDLIMTTTQRGRSLAFDDNLFRGDQEFRGSVEAELGIVLASSSPATTTDTLYSQNGTLFWAGTEVQSNISGTEGQTLVFNSASDATATSSLFIATNGNVGVGTTSPAAEFAVAGLIYAGGTGTSTIEDSLNIRGGLQVGTGSIYIDTDSIDNLSGTLTIQGNGNAATIGGALTLSSTLNINGETFSDLTGDGLTTVSNILTVATSTFNLDPSTIDLTQGYLLVGDPSGNAQATSTIFINTSNGRVGIGTQSPSAQLSVSGDSTFTGASTFSEGITLSDGVPSVTGDTIYRSASTLYFNGFSVHATEPVWWEALSVFDDDDSWEALAHGNGRFVALSDNNDRAMYSDDGMNWATTTIGGDNDQWQDLVYGDEDDRFVAVARGGDDLIAYSDDGITWTTVSFSGDNEDWYGVTYGDGRYVAVGLTGTRVAYSDDGINWTEGTAAGDNDNWISVAHGEGRFVAVATIGDDRVMYSDDGVTWTPISVLGDNDLWFSVAYGNGRFVAVGQSGDRVMYSDDGISWTAATALGDNDTWRDVHYGGGYYVAVGSGPDEVMYSQDAITWTAVSAAGDNDTWQSLTYGEGRFVVGGTAGAGGDLLMVSAQQSQGFLFDKNSFLVTQTFEDGITLASSSPATTTNTLYQQAGTLYFNGSEVGNDLTGTQGQTLVFNGGGDAVATSSLFIATDGNVGVGTTTPSHTLTVDGPIYSEGLEFIDGSIQGLAATPDAFSWNITTAVQGTTNDISQVGFLDRIRDVWFTPGGFNMILLVDDDGLREFSLGTPWDPNTRSLTSTTGLIENSDPKGFFFRNDGRKMYMAGDAVDEVNEYDLTTPWDSSTRSFVDRFAVSENSAANDVFFSPDGRKMFVAGDSPAEIISYELSTAWDITTASVTYELSVVGVASEPNDVSFKPDGTIMFIADNGSNDIEEYYLTTPWDLSTAVDRGRGISLSGSDEFGVYFTPSGERFFAVSDDDITDFGLGFSIDGDLDAEGDAEIGDRFGSNNDAATLRVGGRLSTSETSLLIYSGNASNLIQGFWGTDQTFTVDNDGYVGIGAGSDTPTAYLDIDANSSSLEGLTLTQSGTADIVNIFDDSTEVFTILDGGNVGIGTDNPGPKLDVTYSNNHNSPGQNDRILNWYGPGNGGEEVWNASTTIAAGSNATSSSQPASVGLSLYTYDTADDIYAPALTFGGLSTNGSFMNGAAAISALISGNPDDANFRSGELTFYTQGDDLASRGLAERMRIDADGNVGIGSSTPSARLSIAESAAGATALRIAQSGTGDLLNLDSFGTEVFTVLTNGNVGIFDTAPVAQLSVNQTGTADIVNFFDNGTEIFTILDGGNVGIGTTDPSAALDVVTGTGDSITTFEIGTAGQLTLSRNHALSPSITTNMSSGNPSMTFANSSGNLIRLDGTGNSYFRSGNLGIGTDSPTFLLHASGSASGIKWEHEDREIQLSTPGGKTGFVFNNNERGDYSRFNIVNHDSPTTSERYFHMVFNDTQPAGLVIRYDGNVGIGTTTPEHTLTVDGNLGLTSSGALVFDDGTTQIQAATPDGFGWHLASAKFVGDDGGKVNEQSGTMTGVFFKPDGTKMYTTDDAGKQIDEWNLATPWDISTTSLSYVQSTSTTAYETQIRSIYIRSDGQKIYVNGTNGNDTSEHNLTTPWDISSMSAPVVSELGTGDDNPSATFFSPDGTKMYSVDITSDEINEFVLATPWDLDTINNTPNHTRNISSEDGTPREIFFKSDGTIMYMVADDFPGVFEYHLTTPWELSTASLVDRFQTTFSTPAGIYIRPDGTEMFIAGYGSDTVRKYVLGLTAPSGALTIGGSVEIEGAGALVFYDGSTAQSATAGTALSGGLSSMVFKQKADIDEDPAPGGVSFKPDGTKAYVVGTNADEINEYDLSTPWDISTLSHHDVIDITTLGGANESNPYGLHIRPDGLKAYVLGAGQDFLREYDFGTAWDITTLSLNDSFSVLSEGTSAAGLMMHPAGTKFYTVNFDTDTVYEYDMATAWDVTTASYTGNSFNLAPNANNPIAITANEAGTRFYVGSYSDRTLREYTLSVPWDITTMTYVQSYSILANFTDEITGLYMRADNQKMYMITDDGNEFSEFDMGLSGPGGVLNIGGSFNLNSGALVFSDDSLLISAPKNIYGGLDTVTDTGKSATLGALTNLQGFYMSPDGTRMYGSEANSTDLVVQYDLTTPWDLSTASSASTTFNVGANSGDLEEVTFSTNGEYMYVAENASDDVDQYALATPWDISIVAYVGTFNVTNNVRGLDFRPDGRKMYVGETDDDEIRVYNLSIPWDVTSASSTADTLDLPSAFGMVDNQFTGDGRTLYVLFGTAGIDDGLVYEYSLTTPWDVTTATNTAEYTFDIASFDGSALHVSPDGQHLYVADFPTETVYQAQLGLNVKGILHVESGVGIKGLIAANSGLTADGTLTRYTPGNSFAAGLNMTEVTGSIGGRHAVDGKFVLDNTSNSWTGGWYSNDSYARADGRTLEWVVDTSDAGVSTAQADHMMIGWGDADGLSATNNFSNLPYAVYFNKGSGGTYDLRIYEDGTNRATVASLTWGDVVRFKIVLESTGANYYSRINDGDWVLEYESSYSTESPLYPSIAPYAGRFTIHSMHVYDEDPTLTLSNGRLGINDPSPDEELKVVGGLCVADNATDTCGTASGVIDADGAINANNFDLAENFLTNDETLGAGEIVTYDPVDPEWSIIRATDPSVPIIGVISTEPSLIMGYAVNPEEFDESKVRPVALVGRVPVKVNLENGPIEVGDKLTLSSTAGEAALGSESDNTIGIALQPYDGTGTSTVTIFIDNERNGGLFGVLEESINELDERVTYNTGNTFVYEIEDATIEVGELVALDPQDGAFVERATSTDAKIVGIVATSTPAGFFKSILGSGEHQVAVVHTGRATAKVSTEEVISVGDKLTLSTETPGSVTKATSTSVYTVGFALEAFDPGVSTSTTIAMFVSEERQLSIDQLSQLLATDIETSTTTPTWVESIFTKLFERLADAANGIQKIVADTFMGRQICLSDEEGTSCYTRSQLDAALSGQAAAVVESTEGSEGGSSEGEESGDTTPPTIEIQGNNPAEIEIGADYRDLGVIVTDNVDTNIGHTIYIDSEEVISSINLDTSLPTTYTITYTATDQAGNTTSADRTVIVGGGATEEETAPEENEPEPTPELEEEAIEPEPPVEEEIPETPVEEETTEDQSMSTSTPES